MVCDTLYIKSTTEPIKSTAEPIKSTAEAKLDFIALYLILM